MWVIVIEITKIVVAGNFTCLHCMAKQHYKNNKNVHFTNIFFVVLFVHFSSTEKNFTPV